MLGNNSHQNKTIAASAQKFSIEKAFFEKLIAILNKINWQVAGQVNGSKCHIEFLSDALHAQAFKNVFKLRPGSLGLSDSASSSSSSKGAFTLTIYNTLECQAENLELDEEKIKYVLALELQKLTAPSNAQHNGADNPPLNTANFHGALSSSFEDDRIAQPVVRGHQQSDDVMIASLPNTSSKAHLAQVNTYQKNTLNKAAADFCKKIAEHLSDLFLLQVDVSQPSPAGGNPQYILTIFNNATVNNALNISPDYAFGFTVNPIILDSNSTAGSKSFLLMFNHDFLTVDQNTLLTILMDELFSEQNNSSGRTTSDEWFSVENDWFSVDPNATQRPLSQTNFANVFAEGAATFSTSQHNNFTHDHSNNASSGETPPCSQNTDSVSTLSSAGVNHSADGNLRLDTSKNNAPNV
jgi:hypothetical protein